MKIKHLLACSVSVLMVACSTQPPLNGSPSQVSRQNSAVIPGNKPEPDSEFENVPKITTQVILEPNQQEKVSLVVQLPRSNFQTQDARIPQIAYARAEVVGEGLSKTYYNQGDITINGISYLVEATGTSVTLIVDKLPQGKNRVITLQLYDNSGNELTSMRSMAIFHSKTSQPQAESIFNDSNPATEALDIQIKRRYVPLASVLKKALTLKNTDFLSKYEKSWDTFVTAFDKILYGSNPIGGNTFAVDPQSIDPDEFYTLLTTQAPEAVDIEGFFSTNQAQFADASSDVILYLATPTGFNFNTDLKVIIDDPTSAVKTVAANGSASPLSTTVNNVARGTRQVTITDSADNILGTTTITVDPDTGVTFTDGLGTAGTPFKLLGGSGGLYFSGVTPTAGVQGASITLIGNNFSTTPTNNTVNFGTTPATVTAATATQLTVTVPAGVSGAQVVTVSVAGFTTSSLNFDIKPTISTLSSGTGTIGSSLTITGTGFDGATAGNNTVRFGTTTATVTSATATSLTVTVPPGISGTQNVTVQVGTQTNNGTHNFAVTPVISSLNPSRGLIGSSVTINGTGFDTTPTNNTVRFGTTPATVTAATATALTVTVPPGLTGTQNVSVQVGTQTSANTAADDYTMGPVISSLSASAGTLGSSITINGTDFSATPANNTVRFGTTTATVTAATTSSLTVTVPPGINGVQDVSVEVAGVTSANTAADNFAVIPVISALGASSGAIGSSLTITGTGFNATPASNTVRFGTTTATVTAASATGLTVTVPAGISGVQNVTVQVGTQTNSGTHNYNITPVISSLSATSGIAGSSVTVNGTGFNTTPANNTVKFGTTSATVTAATATQLTVTVPNALAGAQNVTVQVGTQTSTASAFTLNPNLLSLSTTFGTVLGKAVLIRDEILTISGSGFDLVTAGNNQVSFGGINVTASAINAGNLEVRVPVTLVPGDVNVTVTVSSLNTNAVTANLPAISVNISGGLH